MNWFTKLDVCGRFSRFVGQIFSQSFGKKLNGGIFMRIKQQLHDCGKGFKGVVRSINRPGIGIIKFCEFCGKEFRK
jgi:hypothetical protein